MSVNRVASILLASACLAGLLHGLVANAQPAAGQRTPGKPMHVTSSDGTRIAYDKLGKGPALILVGGALADRSGGAALAQLLATRFTVYSYDRRGRGDSTDHERYSVQREIDDLRSVIDAAGGTAFVYGKSSGACLALRAAAELGRKIQKLALYEPPYDDGVGAAARWRESKTQIDALLAADRRAEAVTQFLKFAGAPDEAVASLKTSPAWAGMLAMAPTLAYDNEVVGDDRSVPVGIAARLEVPTLIMDGGASLAPMPFMRATADKLGTTIPGARRQVIEGQGHDVDPEVLAPILAKFFD